MTGDGETMWVRCTGLVDRRTSSNKQSNSSTGWFEVIDSCGLRLALSLAQCKPFRVKGAASWHWKTSLPARSREILNWSLLAVIAGRILGERAATRHILPSADIDVVALFPQISAAIRRLDPASLLVPENLYPVFRETEMGSNALRVLENAFTPDVALRPDLSDLKIAKARQDVSHQKLDKWIAAAIAELSDEKRAA
jgi:hypothetical protein